MNKCLTTPINNRLARLVRVDLITINVIMAMTGILSGVGFLLGTSGNTNYIAITDFAPPVVWTVWFWAYSSEKMLEVLCSVPFIIRSLNSLFGMWLWNYIMLSFLFFDPNPTFPLEYIILMPLIIEVWYLTSLFVARQDKESYGL